ncbi:arsenate reductase (glutaredoxin) [Bdellovibrio bacteriovorus]|uniref:arsenate reductase (glutaredoxin) n=1 Tax=Bdellovibrio TaxID=958 RepID=UPI0035A86BCE
MSKWTIYYNPQCSKCREALSLLQDHKIEPQIVEYLKAHPTEKDLRDIVGKLESPVSSLVRTKEAGYQELNFDINSTEEVVKNLAKHPRLIERPIVIKDDIAVIGRPVENIKKLLS